MRPKRVYKTKKGRYYYLRKGKRVYIRRKKGAPKLSQKQVVRISIKNIIGDKSKRVRKKAKRKKLNYTKRIVPEQVERTAKNTGLPVYLFEPKKIIPSLSDRVSTIAKQQSTSSYDTLLKEIEKVKNLIKIPDNETKAKVPATPVSDEPATPKKYNKTVLKKLIKKKLDESTIDRSTVIDLKKEFNSADTTERIMKLFFEEYNVSLKDKTKYKQLYNIVFEKDPNNIFSILNAFIYTFIEGEDEIERMKEKAKLPVLSPEEKTSIGQDDQQMPASEIEGSGDGDGEGGLYNDEIERINNKVFDSTIPVIAKNELDTLDQYVKPNMKKFGFIINTDPIPQPKNSGGHWRAMYINNCDDYQTIEYFDPLVSTPEKPLISKLREIAKKINPEQYFLFKINNLKTQPDESDNCGYHCILFLEKRFHNVPWSEATYYNDYINKLQPEHSSKGEGEVIKAKRKYKTYL